MKLALLTDGITPYVMGGMQRHSANLAKYLTISGIEVTLVHCVAFGEKKPTSSEVNNLLFGSSSKHHLKNIICLEFPENGKIPGHYIRNSRRYSEDVANSITPSEFDFIYTKGFAGWELLKRKNVNSYPPIGVKFHGYEMYQLLPSFSQKIGGALLRKPTKWNNTHADYVFSYGGKISDLISDLGVDTNKIIELTSGIDASFIRDSEKFVSKKAVKFVFVGRAEIRKGVNEIQVAIQNLLNMNEDFEVHFVGPISSFIEHEKVVFHGSKSSLEEVTSILDEMDVLLCPSHSEGMPNVIIEGMARGLAVLTTRVGAIEVIVNETNGIFTFPNDSSHLTDVMHQFIHLEKSELNNLQKNSVNIVREKLAWEKVSFDLIKKLEHILN